MAGIGVAQDDIALVIGIDPKTLRLRYRVELDKGAILANAKVAGQLFKIATAEKPTRETITAVIFWLKCRAGWSEYAPAPAPAAAALGKKEQADLDATTAGRGTAWADLVH